MNKKQDPKTECIIVRVSPTQKQKVIGDSLKTSLEFSDYIRMKLGL